ncbi:hypothetical protein RCH06_000116 [Polaromonas sp. CG_9.5]|uniref:hypothetical protein n=1 Tax=Polaromonas sp. CG_9.5 TaxID=3071705 RepID=UPI002E0A4E10|nr:hypothetical protein [Polaromonas sp. CG_9.5]
MYLLQSGDMRRGGIAIRMNIPGAQFDLRVAPAGRQKPAKAEHAFEIDLHFQVFFIVAAPPTACGATGRCKFQFYA